MGKNSTIGRKPELVMPAGSMDALKAAVLNGADAVYFGSKKFNARLRAKNFDENSIGEAINFCHYHGKKAYLTINILLKDQELGEAIELAKKAYCLGIDAVIIQDLGLAMALRELLPELKLTASTQMNCHNRQGAEFLANLGFERIVLARELSIKEIIEIKKAVGKKTEIECFVHGALCFSYSGQCMFSSFAFNKSGNRGQCLQPCRLPYTLFSGNNERKGYFLSMADLFTIKKVREMVGAGIDSFKIEGRLKGISYSAIVARVYRKTIDYVLGEGEPPTGNDFKLMQIAFMRKNNEGYMFNEKEMVYPESSAKQGIVAAKVIGFKGKNVELELIEDISRFGRLSVIHGEKIEDFSVKKIIKGVKELSTAYAKEKVCVEFYERPFLEKNQLLYITRCKELDDLAYNTITPIKKTGYSLVFRAKVGEKNSAVISIKGKKKEILSDFTPAQESTSGNDLPEIFEQKLFKENYFLEPNAFKCELTGKPFIPLSVLKKFKNQILKEGTELLFAENKRKINENEFQQGKTRMLKKELEAIEKKEPVFVVFIGKGHAKNQIVREKIMALANTIVLCEGSTHGKTDEFLENFPEKELMIKPNRIQSTVGLERFWKNAGSSGNSIVCSDLGTLNMAIGGQKKFWVGREINVFNSLATKLLTHMGATGIIPSIELSLKEIQELENNAALIPLVFFYPVLMVSKAYAKSSILEEGNHLLKDRKNFLYKLTIDNNRIAKLYNPVPVDMLFEIEKFSEFNKIGLDLTSLSDEEAIKVLDYAIGKKTQGTPKKTAKFTRGHYYRPIE